MRILVCILISIFSPQISRAWTISGGRLTEDFTDSSHWDAANSTGLWNIVSHAAEAGRVSAASASQSISFGDGSDGVLSTSSGYTFNTDQHPNGYHFISIDISGGTIQVQGSNPLVIHSLSTIRIVPSLSVRGGNGTPGTGNGSSTQGPTGGTATAGLCSGGAGGNTTPTAGGAGLTYTGAVDLAGGASASGATSATPPGGAIDGPDIPQNFGTVANAVRCGAGGAGGGGHLNGANHSTGGAGGGGGGTVHITAVGSISYTSIDASGGNGGAGGNDGFCGGSGAGGNGGAVWVQSLQTVSGNTPTVTAGAIATACALSSGGSFSGSERVDTATSSDAGAYSTGNVAANQTYTVISQAYDLGTQNAAFFSQPTLATTLNGGTISVSYSGSSNAQNYSSATSDITTLSNQNIRYIKIRISIATASSAGSTPQLNSIQIPFEELNIKISGGCGSLQDKDSDPRITFLFWVFLILLFWKTRLLNLNSAQSRYSGITYRI